MLNVEYQSVSQGQSHGSIGLYVRQNRLEKSGKNIPCTAAIYSRNPQASALLKDLVRSNE